MGSCLDKRLEDTRMSLYEKIQSNSRLTEKEVVFISQELDKLILEKMRSINKKYLK